ncbi:MAG: 4-hydroxy-3-methylbut-2-en-1-yl diphosphate synthase [Bacteroidetes bacterium]|nr:4-hydroxy-3-methylbut-2-en-1-yl diphosphate synthase [Bacteroidota bacterium]
MNIENLNNVLGYCDSLVNYKRRKTLTVKLGDMMLGSEHPILPQSMTTTDTMDTMGSVDQIIRMVNAGCQLVRLTAPSINEAQNLAEIKKELQKRGIKVPLVADIHFTPNAAELAAKIVEKVRVNPGNYADKKKFNLIEYTDADYQEELERIREKFTPLVKICKEYGTAMRIGTNHGSLSDRIMSRYGDTPLGMVESAMEFLRICEDENYHNIVLSMKSSNPQVMVQAYRLLVKTMKNGLAKRNMPNGDDLSGAYPLHLGVTEAGDGDDGRIKSALGIGTLLEDGIGDTVRVSLTEDPEFEVPVAKKLIARYEKQTENISKKDETYHSFFNPFYYTKRESIEVYNIGKSQVPRVIANYATFEKVNPEDLKAIGHLYDANLDKWHMSDMGADYIYLGKTKVDFMLPMGLKAIYDIDTWNVVSDKSNAYPMHNASEFLTNFSSSSKTLNFVKANTNEINDIFLNKLKEHKNLVLILCNDENKPMREFRSAFLKLQSQQINNPVIINPIYHEDEEHFMLFASTDIGALLIDGFGDGLLVDASQVSMNRVNEICFGILQAARTRISKTEYISCPSCGRTLFDLQETTAMIRKRTDHLKGIKIAIMGCIVNGPGEMADADYGYVGSGIGKITLYKGKEVVKRNIPSENAVNELIDLIRNNGDWVETVI